MASELKPEIVADLFETEPNDEIPIENEDKSTKEETKKKAPFLKSLISNKTIIIIIVAIIVLSIVLIVIFIIRKVIGNKDYEEKYNELTDELVKAKTSNDNMSSTIEDYKEQIKNLQTANSSLNSAIKQKSAEYNNYIKELETTINSQSRQLEEFADKQIEKASKLHAGVAKTSKINKRRIDKHDNPNAIENIVVVEKPQVKPTKQRQHKKKVKVSESESESSVEETVKVETTNVEPIQEESQTASQSVSEEEINMDEIMN